MEDGTEHSVHLLIMLPTEEAGMLVTMAKMEGAPVDWIVAQAIRGMWPVVSRRAGFQPNEDPDR